MTTQIMLKYRDPYLFYGRVIDGPFEGETVESDSPYFVGHFQRPVTVLSAGSEVDRVVYRWLSGYRAWAWVQPPARGT